MQERVVKRQTGQEGYGNLIGQSNSLQGIKESDKESVSRGCDEEEDLSIIDCS